MPEIINTGIHWNYSNSPSLFLPKDSELLPHLGGLNCNKTRGRSTPILFNSLNMGMEVQMMGGTAFHNSTLLLRGKLHASSNYKRLMFTYTMSSVPPHQDLIGNYLENWKINIYFSKTCILKCVFQFRSKLGRLF